MGERLYWGELPVDLTPGEALCELHTMRPIPRLVLHFPSAPCTDFNDSQQRYVLRCSCGETWHDGSAENVKVFWAYHAARATKEPK
jgi:hypothetical protein